MRFVHHFIEFSMPEASISLFIVKLLNNFAGFFFSIIVLMDPDWNVPVSHTQHLNVPGVHIFSEET